MPFNTSIDGLTIQELLRVIANSRLSGVLTVIDGLRSGRIVFTWGRVTHASIEGQAHLGELLVSRGRITVKDLAIALRHQRKQDRPRPLGTVLTALDMVDTSEIQSLLREQMRNAFFELMEWEKGSAHLQVDIASALASVRVDVSLDTQALLLDAARMYDEASSRASVPADIHDSVEVAAAEVARSTSEEFDGPAQPLFDGEWNLGEVLDSVLAEPNPRKSGAGARKRRAEEVGLRDSHPSMDAVRPRPKKSGASAKPKPAGSTAQRKG